jgi:hypothetical protein
MNQHVAVSVRARLRGLPVAFWVEGFVVFNLAFLGLDIWIAHAANDFEQRIEWLPVLFSCLAPLLLLPNLFSTRYRERARALSLGVGSLAILLGIAGMLLHLQSAFFSEQTLHNLVYTAPFVAPLSYVGVGLLLVLNRLEVWDSPSWSLWVVLLTLGGFVGNLALSTLDHAQNGFFHPSEWIAVAAAALATSFLLMVMVTPDDPQLMRASAVVLGLAALVGVLGFALHAWSDVSTRPGENLMERMVYGAPVFAPLLFPNLSLLGGLGLWSLWRAREAQASR